MTNSTAERSVDMLLRDADRAQRAGDRASATAAFEAILSRKPDHPVALNAVGMAALGATTGVPRPISRARPPPIRPPRRCG